MFAIVSVFVSLHEGLGIAITPRCKKEGDREGERKEECVCGTVLLTKEHHSAETSA